MTFCGGAAAAAALRADARGVDFLARGPRLLRGCFSPAFSRGAVASIISIRIVIVIVIIVTISIFVVVVVVVVLTQPPPRHRQRFVATWQQRLLFLRRRSLW